MSRVSDSTFAHKTTGPRPNFRAVRACAIALSSVLRTTYNFTADFICAIRFPLLWLMLLLCASHAWAQVQSGSYTGNGSDGRAIAGLGFQPDLVIVKSAGTQNAVIRSSTMTGDNTKDMTGATALTANYIQSLDSDGFTIGTDAKVNGNGAVYQWLAFKTNSAKLKLGTYSGDSQSSHAITGVGFSPELVIIMSAAANNTVVRSSADGLTYQLDASSGNSMVNSLDSNGFTLGSDPRVNSVGTTYHYAAWNVIAGEFGVAAYSGDSTAHHTVTGLGFKPEIVMIKSLSSYAGVMHSQSLGDTTNSSQFFTANANVANEIEALQSDGFQLGTAGEVNQAGVTYVYFAWKETNAIPTKLVITSVNAGSAPTYGASFSVVVQAQDAGGTVRNVTADTAVTLSVNTGTGSVGGTVTGTITSGTSSVTISGVTYSKAENGVILTATRTSGNTLTAGNSSSFNVNKATVTVSSGLAANNKAYDGTTAATINSNNVVLSGVIAADTANAKLSTNGYSATFASASVGTGNSVTLSGLTLTGSAAANYTLTQPTLTANITAATVTVSSGISANNKVYDGATTATISSNNAALSGVTAGDASNVRLSTNGYAANFASASAGNGKAVTVSGLTLTGSSAGNYTLTQPSVTANITPATVTVSSGLTVNNKTYDATTTATINSNNVALSGVLAADAANVKLSTNGYSAAFASATVGNGKTVSLSGLALTGSAAGNYTLTQPSLSANITAATVTVSSGLAANAKPYDGATTATINSNNVALSGVIAADSANVRLSTNGYSATFSSASVGNGKTVTISGLTLTGSAAGNYTLTQPGLTANIAAATVTISSGLSANNKIYDGTTSASLSSNNVVFSGVIAGDAANVKLSTNGYSATFASVFIGTGKTVTVGGLTLTGSAAGNYTLTQPSLIANLTTRTLTVSATGVNKVYDGMTNATVTLSDDRVAGDSFSTSYASASFADKNVGTGKTVSVTEITISGGVSSNYTFNTSTTTTANLTAATLTVTANNTNRVYGAANPAFTASYSGLASGDTSAVLSGAPSVSTAANASSTVAGSPYAITVTSGTLTAANYVFTFVSGQLTITSASSSSAVSTSSNPSPTGSNATFSATLTAMAPGTGTPTGTVQFLADGSLLGSSVNLVAGVASLTTNSLSHGTHVITARYAGDGNFSGSTNTLTPDQVINTRPVVSSINQQRFPTSGLNVRITTLLAGATDADNDALTFVSFSATSANGGTVSSNGTWLCYQPANGFTNADSLTFIIKDSFGLQTTGTVSIAIVNDLSFAQNIRAIDSLGDNSSRIRFSVIPFRTYTIQNATNVVSPTWFTLSATNADALGQFDFADTPPPGSPARYYRSAYP